MKGIIAIAGVDYETTEFGELHLWNFAMFAQRLSEGKADQSNWDAAASSLLTLCPGLESSGLVTYDNVTKKGQIYLSVEQLEAVFNAFKRIWEQRTTEKIEPISPTKPKKNQSRITQLKAELKALEDGTGDE